MYPADRASLLARRERLHHGPNVHGPRRSRHRGRCGRNVVEGPKTRRGRGRRTRRHGRRTTPHALLALSGYTALPHRRKGALGRLVARPEQAQNGLLARRMLLATHDATRLGLHQVLLLEATGRVLGRAMEYFCLAADRLCLRHVYRISRKE